MPTGSGPSVEPVDHIAKLDPSSGVLDTTFSPGPTNGFSGEVFALAVVGSSLYVGGAFDSYRNSVETLSNLAKLDATSGALDSAFATSSGSTMERSSNVRTIVSNGSTLLVGGDFGYYGGSKRVASAALVDPATGAPSSAP